MLGSANVPRERGLTRIRDLNLHLGAADIRHGGVGRPHIKHTEKFSLQYLPKYPVKLMR